jgi:chromate transporter
MLPALEERMSDLNQPSAEHRVQHPEQPASPASPEATGTLTEIAMTMGRLGCIAFGGPVAHLAHFRRELVERRRWLSDEDFIDLVAFCQFLPGPASSQVGMGIGLRRGGFLGMLVAWFCFTMPSVVVLIAAAAGLGALTGYPLGWLHGLLAGVVAIVAHAVLKMGAKCCPNRAAISIAIVATMVMLAVPTTWMQLVVIAGGALLGFALPRPALPESIDVSRNLGKKIMLTGWSILIVLVLLPIFLSVLTGREQANALTVYGVFAQTGSLVFGGGHVVLPMLEAEVVGPGWMTEQQFLAGYGATQAMPGPIFTLSAFLGAVTGANLATGWGSFFMLSSMALLGIFMPSFGFICAWYPMWDRLRQNMSMRRALQGINAAVVGLLVAALYDPVWTKAMAVENHVGAVCIVIGAWLLLAVWKLPAWAVVALAALSGVMLEL